MSDDAQPEPYVPRTRPILIPTDVPIESTVLRAISNLSVALVALQMAMDAADQAHPGAFSLPEDTGYPDEAKLLRRNWSAAAQLVNAAIKKTYVVGMHAVDAVETMLAAK